MRTVVPYRMLVAVVTLVAGSSVASASVPRLFSFQGRLTGVNGPTADLVIKFWDASNGGNQLFVETHTGVPLSDGVFSLRIGSVNNGIPDSAIGAQQVWLGVSVNGGPELPRTRLVAVPWAFEARSAAQLVAPGTSSPTVVLPSGGGAVEFHAADDGLMVGIIGDLPGPDLCMGTEEKYYHRHSPAGTEYLSILLDSNDEPDYPCDSQILLYDDSEHLAVRLHSDRTNGAAELSLFMEDASGTLGETVELLANSEGGDHTGGQLRLRTQPDSNGVVYTGALLKAAGSDVMGVPRSGGRLELRAPQSTTPLITAQAGSDSVLEPTYLELNFPGSDTRTYVTPGSVTLRDGAGTDTVSLSYSGRITTKSLEITGGCDLSEQFEIDGRGHALEPGMVVSIDPARPGALAIATAPYDRRVAGIISGAGGVNPGMLMGQRHSIADGAHPVALSGRVWTWCDASHGAIEPGDLLTTSNTPGHAMKVADYDRARGAVAGKAMTALARGRGLVLVLVQPQ